MLLACGAILAQLKLFGGIFGVFHVVVVAVFTFGASQRNFQPVAFFVCHFFIISKNFYAKIYTP